MATPHRERKSHLETESPQFKDRPHIWVQWKGTDVCCDVHCACGCHSHFDGDFLYFLKCPKCAQCYEVGTHIALYPVTAEEAGEHVKLPTE